MYPMHCRSFEHLETAAASCKKRRRREGGRRHLQQKYMTVLVLHSIIGITRLRDLMLS